ncbi:MAG: DUF1643 domain-containing protein [Lachnospiraceae bacterium]|nr:DUF1643 domain-containing protein [Lachnospiraceae bacterium]
MAKNKITNLTLTYPTGQEPDTISPTNYQPYRYIIGKTGKNPLVAICMNPSAARDNVSDRTVNRVIQTSIHLGYDGWFVVNIYPERATDAAMLDHFDKNHITENVAQIRQLLKEQNIKEVWGAWGETKYEHLKKGRNALLDMLREESIQIFAYQINSSGNPKHPLYLKIDAKNKVYLNHSF